MRKVLITLALLAAAAPALATDFTGTSVTASLLYPNVATTYAGPVTATVGAGVEFPNGAFAPAAGSIDVGASSFTFFTNQNATYGTATFNGYRLDFAKAITSVSLAASSTFTPVGYSFAGHSVFVNVSGKSVTGSDQATFNVTAVPEPASWGMMVAGFGMIGAFHRASRRNRVLA